MEKKQIYLELAYHSFSFEPLRTMNSFSVPVALEPLELQSGAWQPQASSLQLVCPLQTPSGGQTALLVGIFGCGARRSVCPPCGSAEPSHLVPTQRLSSLL